MKISKRRLVQIIREELDDITEGLSDLLNAPVFLDPESPLRQDQYQNDPEEALMNQKTAERIQEIDAEIARLQAEKESLMINLDSSLHTHDQIVSRGPNE